MPKRHDTDAINRARRIFRLVTIRPHRRAGLQHLVDLRPEHLGQVAEFEFATAFVLLAEMAARGFVGVEHLQVASDDDARAAEFAQHVGHHLVVAGELVMQPDVAEREAHLFEQVENEFQLDVDERFAGDPAIEHRHPDNAFLAGNGHRDLGAEQFKFLLRLGVRPGLVAVAAENPAQSGHLGADAGIQRKFNMFEQSGGKTDGGHRAQAAAVLRRRRFGERRAGAVEKNGGAVDAEDFTEKQQELSQHGLGVQRMGEDGREIAQHVERLRRIDEAAGGRQFGRAGK